jgi:hypothetical protein
MFASSSARTLRAAAVLGTRSLPLQQTQRTVLARPNLLPTVCTAP